MCVSDEYNGYLIQVEVKGKHDYARFGEIRSQVGYATVEQGHEVAFYLDYEISEMAALDRLPQADPADVARQECFARAKAVIDSGRFSKGERLYQSTFRNAEK